MYNNDENMIYLISLSIDHNIKALADYGYCNMFSKDGFRLNYNSTVFLKFIRTIPSIFMKIPDY